MKKIILGLLISIMTVVSILTLTSCDEEQKSPREGLQDYVSDRYYFEDVSQEIFDTASKKITFDRGRTFDDTYANLGLVVTVDQNTDNVGFYSLHYQKFLINEQFCKDWLRYKVFETPGVGYILAYYYQGFMYCYDSFGNRIFTDIETSLDYFNRITVTSKFYQSTPYISVNTLTENYIFSYSSYGSLYRESSIPKEEPKYPSPNQPNINNFLNTCFNDRYYGPSTINLRDIGLYDYYLTYLYPYKIVIFRDKQEICSFTLDQEAQNISAFGGKILYQVIYELPKESEGYTYCVNGKYYELKTYVLELDTGYKGCVNLNYIINGITPVCNQKDYKYDAAVANVTFIDNGHLTNTATYLINSNGGLICDIGSMDLTNFTKLGENYLDLTYNILYDPSMRVISAFGSDITVDKTNNLIWCSRFDSNSESLKHGAVDFNGVVKIPLNYVDINPISKDGYFIAKVYGNSYDLVNINDGSTQYYASLMHIGKNIYYNYDEHKFMDICNAITFDTMFETDAIVEGSCKNSLSNSTYAFAKIKTSNKTEYYTFSKNDVYNKKSFTSIGEKKTSGNYGKNERSAIPMLRGNNNFTTCDRPTYLSFKTSYYGIYTIDTDSPWGFNIYSKDGEEKVYYDTETYDGKQLFMAKPYKEVFVEFDSTTLYTGNIRINELNEQSISLPDQESNSILEGGVKVYKYSNYNSTAKRIYYSSNRSASLDLVIYNGNQVMSASSGYLDVNGNGVVYFVFINRSPYSNSLRLSIEEANSNTGYNIINDRSYPFYKSGSYYESTNTGNNSSSTLTLDITRGGNLSFYYEVSSESGCDIMSVRINSSTKLTKSGEYSDNVSFRVYSGDIVEITYSKDGSVNSGRDKIRVGNFGIM